MALDPSSVDQIHACLVVRYGRRWFDFYDGLDPAAVKADWARCLGDVPAAGIAYALDNLPDTVPNVGQFKRLCFQRPEEVVRLSHDKRGPMPEAVQAVFDQVRAARPPTDRREWAQALRQREVAGERLSIAQMASWRMALGTDDPDAGTQGAAP